MIAASRAQIEASDNRTELPLAFNRPRAKTDVMSSTRPPSSPRKGPIAAYRSLFSNRNYTLYMSSNGVSLIGLWLHRIAVMWLMWELTDQGFWIGAVAFADLFPAVILGPLAGVFADRHDRIMIIAVTQSLAAVQAIAVGTLVFLDLMTPELLVALTLMVGMVSAFSQPPRLAIVPNLVRARDLNSALAFNSVIFNSARSVGPLIGGATIFYFGYIPAFAFNAFSYILFVVVLLNLTVDKSEEGGSKGASVLQDMVEGIRYAVSHGAIGPILMISIVIALIGRPFLELLPGFADKVFSEGVQGFAMLTTAAGIGAVVSGVWLASRGRMDGLTNISLAAVILTGVFAILFVSTDNFYIGLGAVMMASFFISVCGTGTQTLVQSTVDGRMRGRVMSLWGLIFRGVPSIGAWLLGTSADRFGFEAPTITAGLLTILASLGLYRWRAQLIRLVERPAAERDLGPS